MLETVRSEIKNLPSCTFSQYFIEYVMSVQDSNIDSEFSYLRRHNQLDILNVDRLISEYLSRLVKQ